MLGCAYVRTAVGVGFAVSTGLMGAELLDEALHPIPVNRIRNATSMQMNLLILRMT